jgi:hypothetical protein
MKQDPINHTENRRRTRNSQRQRNRRNRSEGRVPAKDSQSVNHVLDERIHRLLARSGAREFA